MPVFWTYLERSHSRTWLESRELLVLEVTSLGVIVKYSLVRENPVVCGITQDELLSSPLLHGPPHFSHSCTRKIRCTTLGRDEVS